MSFFFFNNLKSRIFYCNILDMNLKKSINSLDSPTRKEIDRLWAEEAERRVQQIRDRKLDPIRGEDVFKEIRKTIIS